MSIINRLKILLLHVLDGYIDPQLRKLPNYGVHDHKFSPWRVIAKVGDSDAVLRRECIYCSLIEQKRGKL